VTASAQSNAGPRPLIGGDAAILSVLQVPQPASSQIGENQIATIDPSTGYVALNDGATPNQIGAGFGHLAKLSPSEPAGNSVAHLWQGQIRNLEPSTIAGDAFAATDVGKTWWGKDENTIGKLSNYGGSNRSMGGVFLGMFNRLPEVLGGVVGWLLGRASHMADNEAGGLVAYAADATATTDQGSATDPILIPRKKTHGRISSIEIIPSADLAATGGTDKRVITIYKIDTLTNTVSAVVGTFTTATQALAKRVPTQFSLTATSALLDLLETDVLGYASLSSASGATVPQSIIRVNMKVQ
jgi:hypothetical protein